MDVVRAYSNRHELLVDLDQASQRLDQALADPKPTCRSVRSTGRVGRKWAMQDRLNAEDLRALVTAYHAGTQQWKLAEQYGISVSSVKRLLRLHRAAAWVVERQADA